MTRRTLHPLISCQSSMRFSFQSTLLNFFERCVLVIVPPIAAINIAMLRLFVYASVFFAESPYPITWKHWKNSILSTNLHLCLILCKFFLRFLQQTIISNNHICPSDRPAITPKKGWLMKPYERRSINALLMQSSLILAPQSNQFSNHWHYTDLTIDQMKSHRDDVDAELKLKQSNKEDVAVEWIVCASVLQATPNSNPA